MSSKRLLLALLALPVAALGGAGCSDFSTARVVPARGTFGAELYSVLCDRVGAQALREDVTGASFHAVCNPDASGSYAGHVDTTQLPPLTATTTPDGQPVTLAVQQQRRTLHIARVEALARDRAELIAAFDGMLPATTIPELPLASGECPDPDAAEADTSGRLSLQKEFSVFLGRIVDLYDDDTIPFATRALGDVMNEVKADPDLQAALARVDSRQGYRPLPLALGVARPALAYPRLVELARSLFGVLLGDATTPGAQSFVQSQLVLYNELRTPSTTPPLTLLGATADPALGGRLVLSRPRSMLEAVRQVVLTEDPAFTVGNPSYVGAPRSARVRGGAAGQRAGAGPVRRRGRRPPPGRRRARAVRDERRVDPAVPVLLGRRRQRPARRDGTGAATGRRRARLRLRRRPPDVRRRAGARPPPLLPAGSDAEARDGHEPPGRASRCSRAAAIPRRRRRGPTRRIRGR